MDLKFALGYPGELKVPGTFFLDVLNRLTEDKYLVVLLAEDE